jgi:hypothetical protein
MDALVLADRILSEEPGSSLPFDPAFRVLAEAVVALAEENEDLKEQSV